MLYHFSSVLFFIIQTIYTESVIRDILWKDFLTTKHIATSHWSSHHNSHSSPSIYRDIKVEWVIFRSAKNWPKNRVNRISGELENFHAFPQIYFTPSFLQFNPSYPIYSIFHRPPASFQMLQSRREYFWICPLAVFLQKPNYLTIASVEGKRVEPGNEISQIWDGTVVGIF